MWFEKRKGTWEETMSVTIHIIPAKKHAVTGKLADVELHFSDGPLAGSKLVGFAIWKGRGGQDKVSFPARSYVVDGEKRQFVLLRPIGDLAGQEQIRRLILDAYAANGR
jgi:hypothetical protein